MFSGIINTTKELKKPEIKITKPEEKETLETSQCFPPPLKPVVNLDLNPPPPEGWEKINKKLASLEPLNPTDSLPRPQQINYNPVNQLIKRLTLCSMTQSEIETFVKLMNDCDEQSNFEMIIKTPNNHTLIGIKYECKRTNEQGCIALFKDDSLYRC